MPGSLLVPFLADATSSFNLGDLAIGLIVTLAGGAAGFTIYRGKSTALLQANQAGAIVALQATVGAVQATNAELTGRIVALTSEREALKGRQSQPALPSRSTEQARHDPGTMSDAPRLTPSPSLEPEAVSTELPGTPDLHGIPELAGKYRSAEAGRPVQRWSPSA